MARRNSRSTEERFLEKVEQVASGCWDWKGYVQPNGYGQFQLGKVMGAHRASWLMFRGEIPQGHDVCHTCDNRKCVNPAHLFPGSRLENVRDMQAKGRERHAQGEEAPASKLSAADVLEIRKSSESVDSLAKSYGVSGHAVWCAKTNRSWKHI